MKKCYVAMENDSTLNMKQKKKRTYSVLTRKFNRN